MEERILECSLLESGRRSGLILILALNWTRKLVQLLECRSFRDIGGFGFFVSFSVIPHEDEKLGAQYHQ
jgi:hypothetical protein